MENVVAVPVEVFPRGGEGSSEDGVEGCAVAIRAVMVLAAHEKNSHGPPSIYVIVDTLTCYMLLHLREIGNADD